MAFGEESVKQHPFQGFDQTKFKFTPRGEEKTSNDTTVAEPETPEIPKPEPEVPETPEEPETGDEGKVADAPEAPENPETPVVDETPTGTYTEEDFNSDLNTRLQEISGGRITTQDHISNILKENDTLKEQLKNKELEFPSERAKKLYEFAVKNDGNELAAAGQYLRVQSLDLATLSPKEKQFEAFVLKRADLTREEAKEIFDARYSREFADVENDIEKKDEHKVRTMEAEKTILAMQEEFKKAPERTVRAPEQISAEDLENVTIGVDQSLSDFGGIVMQFGESPEDQVKVPMQAADVAAFREAMINPNKFLERIMENSVVDGKFSKEAYRDNMFRLWNLDRIVTEIGASRFTAGQVAIVKDRKNSVAPKGTTGTTAPSKETYAQAFGKAVKSAG